jgi:hypothetical protein
MKLVAIVSALFLASISDAVAVASSIDYQGRSDDMFIERIHCLGQCNFDYKYDPPARTECRAKCPGHYEDASFVSGGPDSDLLPDDQGDDASHVASLISKGEAESSTFVSEGSTSDLVPVRPTWHQTTYACQQRCDHLYWGDPRRWGCRDRCEYNNFDYDDASHVASLISKGEAESSTFVSEGSTSDLVPVRPTYHQTKYACQQRCDHLHWSDPRRSGCRDRCDYNNFDDLVPVRPTACQQRCDHLYRGDPRRWGCRVRCEYNNFDDDDASHVASLISKGEAESSTFVSEGSTNGLTATHDSQRAIFECQQSCDWMYGYNDDDDVRKDCYVRCRSNENEDVFVTSHVTKKTATKATPKKGLRGSHGPYSNDDGFIIDDDSVTCESKCELVQGRSISDCISLCHGESDTEDVQLTVRSQAAVKNPVIVTG